jgi:hypothetical protein
MVPNFSRDADFASVAIRKDHVGEINNIFWAIIAMNSACNTAGLLMCYQRLVGGLNGLLGKVNHGKV